MRTFVMPFLLLFFAATAAMAAPYDRFTVHSVPFASRDTAVKNSGAIAAYGYHPVIQIEKTDGTQYYFLEMGSFDNMNTAIELVTLFKNMGYEFFIVGATGAEGAGDTASSALIQTGKTARLFPYQGEPVVDQLSLLEAIPYDNTPIPRPPWDTGAPAPDKNDFTRAAPRMLKTEPFSMPNVPELSYVERRLRDTAWELRSKGFDVVSDTETYFEPSGVLVGIFPDMDDAGDLQRELEGYGYNTSIEQDDSPEGTQFRVYAEVQQIQPPIISLENEPVNKETAPQNTGDLLKLERPKKNRGMSPMQ
jgi:hypothetical protein